MFDAPPGPLLVIATHTMPPRGHGWEYATWPHIYPQRVASALTCEYGQVDQLGEALRAFKAAQAGVPRAEVRARTLVAAARARVDAARANLAGTIVAEYQRGARVADLASRAEYSRENIRRILRAAGVEPD